jgi:hypothetical protein
MLGPSFPVLDVMGEAFLARVEVDRGDPLTRFQQRNRDMHRDSGFSRAALLVAENNAEG